MAVRPQLLIDSDIFINLAGADLLTSAVSLLGFELSDTRHFKALPHMMRKSKKKNLFPDIIIERVVNACNKTPTLNALPDAVLEQELGNNPNIDPGEAVLYALLAKEPIHLLTSNDKRAMRALSTDNSLQNIRSAVAGRIICLETLILKMIDELGVEFIGKKLEPVLFNNYVLRMAFSPHFIANPEECIWSLHSYENKLKREVGEDFLWEFS